MTEEGAKKKYAHLKGLIAGKLKTGNAIRDELIVSDATLNLAQLIKVRPNIKFEDTPEQKEEEEKPVEEKSDQPTKSKGKK